MATAVRPLRKKVVVVMGATGCGKSKLSLNLDSRFFSSEIVNSEKIQVYRGLDITTNKIPLSKRENVKHHLLGKFDSSDSHPEFTPADFRASGSIGISQILERRKLPIIAGGSNSFISGGLDPSIRALLQSAVNLSIKRFDDMFDLFTTCVLDIISWLTRYFGNAQKLAKREAQRRIFTEQKASRGAKTKIRALDVLSYNDVRYRKYTLEEVKEATNGFSDSMKIGEGGYGQVYRGTLDHTAVAIKVLKCDVLRQFQQEVKILSCMRHPNLVILIGACSEYGCLVYEFMDNGSLADRLLRKGNTPPIPWGIRFKIAADIATALLFLHQGKPEPLVHRDLKPDNVLLDHNYTCKLSDVGLARLVPPKVAGAVTQSYMTTIAGTLYYIDPEYQHSCKLGTKSDIYSLGVTIFQIITARSPKCLAHDVGRAIEEGTFEHLLDPTVPNWPIEEALRLAKLAMKCTELRKKDRPDLATEILPELNRLKEFGMKRG